MTNYTARRSSLLEDLADDVLDIIGRSLSSRDICNVSMCCKSLNACDLFDKSWLTHCEELEVISSKDLVEWRKAVLSYKALFRFLTSVKPLLGIWVCPNPVLGNIVYVVPSFASVVGCRIIPQKLGTSVFEGSPILWSPVFEVISDNDGASAFILHGREKGQDYIYPGTVKSVDNFCNVLLLEVERKQKTRGHLRSDEEMDREVLKSVRVPFRKLYFKDRQKLIEIVTVGIQVLGQTCPSMFPCMGGDEDKFQKEVAHLSERQATLITIFKLGGGNMNWTATHRQQFPQIDVSENEDAELYDSLSSGDAEQIDVSKNKVGVLDEFLISGDTIGLTLHASTMDLSYYNTWPRRPHGLFAWYKLPVQLPTGDQEYAGLWGGTFGWPPGEINYLLILNLSYHKKSRKTLLLATKILEGSNHADYPNGSTMFTVNVGMPSTKLFPWSSGVRQAFMGKGIASGYGYRCPGSKPGSLFVLEDGVLAFLWEDPSAVLTLRRLDLEELLKKGQRVPPLPPIDNFG